MRPRGKYTKIDPNNPLAVGRCDYSGLLCRRRDLEKQMRYAGNGEVWTGFWVHKKFKDKLNAQMLTPVLTPDPWPVYCPRPDGDA